MDKDLGVQCSHCDMWCQDKSYNCHYCDTVLPTRNKEEKEDWKPKQGEMVLVEVCNNDWRERLFITFFKEVYYCTLNDVHSSYLEGWTHCKPIPKLPVWTHEEIAEKFGLDDFEYKSK